LIDPASITVLVVDDDAMVGEIYQLTLQRAGFRVLVAADGLAALQAVGKTPPDFIFLDIKMPALDGIEVLRRLKAGEATRAIPVVMLSNFDDPGLMKQTRDLGASDYFVKAGVDPAGLPAVVLRWLTPVR
jgi:CheY-like chemotaxis protein